MEHEPQAQNTLAGGSEKRRRPRYPGTHPRQFEQRYKELDPEAHPEIQEHVRAQGRTPAGTHVPVLLNEVMDSLAPAPGEIVADCTVGYGGHAVEFLRRIAPNGRLIGFDVDPVAIEKARARLARVGGSFSLHRGNYAGIGKLLASERLAGYDIIFADLGVSSMQIDDPARGFSYKHDGPLDMRMDARIRSTAADLLATLSFEQLSSALAVLGDEPDHERIARRIVQQRASHPIARTSDLVRLILDAKGLARRAWRQPAVSGAGGIHPAALTFQALRILVNDELAALSQLLRMAPYCLRTGGRIGIISFHSGEDRLVKHAFKDGLRAGVYAAVCEEVVRPSPQELRANPRSAPAKFRWARKPHSEH
ncbi:MAG TPA: 16S rRNA (cytosine(1402)-N(4))-methyltransferase RsmH [Phycisphaerae bacterium]